MGLTIGTRQLTRAVSDGTGLSEEEIELLVAATALVAALVGLLRAVDAVVAVWPGPSGWARK